MSSLGAAALLVIPIQIDIEPVAALHVFHDTPDTFDEVDLAFATATGHLCGQAIDRLRLHHANVCRHALVDQVQ